MAQRTDERLNIWATVLTGVIAGGLALLGLPFFHLAGWSIVVATLAGTILGGSLVQLAGSRRDRKQAFWIALGTAVVITVVCLVGHQSSSSVSAGPPPSQSATPSRIEPSPYPAPGKIRFFDPEIDPNVTYPNALVAATEPPTVQAVPITGYQTPPALELTMRHLGVSHIELTVKDPHGNTISVDQFVSTEDTMVLAYNFAREIAGSYTLTITDTDSGMQTTSSIDLAAEPYTAGMQPEQIGLLPRIRLSTITGHACDETGAHISIRGVQVRSSELMTAYLPAGLTSPLGRTHEYIGIQDNWGNGYWDVVVKAEHCTNKDIPGFRFIVGTLTKPQLAELDNVSVPN